MSRTSTGNHKLLGIALVGICALLLQGYVSLLAQDSAPHWVPFVAKLVEEHTNTLNATSVHATIEGVYVRNSQGASYTRRAFSVRSALRVQGAINVAFLHDRPNHTTYIIDFTKKTIKQQSHPAGNPDFALEPPLRPDFERRHASDLFLGKQIVSGVECEGYKIADQRHKGKYSGEGWYVPSLNFLMVRYHGRLPDGAEMSTLLQDIEPGKEPDPSFFRLPEGFKRVK